jgi:hypothetical protein
MGKILPASGFDLYLLRGINKIMHFNGGGYAKNNAQIESCMLITGFSSLNTDNGKLYVNIVSDGGANYHVNLYKDSARTLLVGHSAVIGAGSQVTPLVADNTSGLSGYLELNLSAASVTVEVQLGLAFMSYSNTYYSLEEVIN